MAEFYAIFLSSVLLKVGVGGVGWGEVLSGKKPWLGYPWSNHDARTMVYATLVGHRGSACGSDPMSPPLN